ncbi:cyclin-D4-1-like isoform X2 [Mercurialis annua]|uniref:cyclin-D4-1-like isoform X2 n=1 Tax=Mercurialis annua TaxID=3986 RepID=UPI002160DD96|nr:cyclin-D4-1-like isoform X2 [Mercurialis annua]
METVTDERLSVSERRQVEQWLAVEPKSLNVRARTHASYWKLRREIVRFIAQSAMIDLFDANVRYLAMNIFDRFTSTHTLPTLGERDVAYRVKILALSCLFIGVKMNDDSIDKIINLKQEPYMEIDEKDVETVESLILDRIGPLENCVNAVNALYYVPSFSSIAEERGSKFKSDVTQLIYQSHEDIRCIQFRPSSVAASAVLMIVKAMDAAKYSECMERFTIKDLQLNREELEACYSKMSDYFNPEIDTLSPGQGVGEIQPVDFDLDETHFPRE